MSDAGGESTEVNPITGFIRFGSIAYPYCAPWPPPRSIEFQGLVWVEIRHYSTVSANHPMAATTLYPAVEYGVTGF